MSIVKLFSAIYHNDLKEISAILTVEPALTNQTFKDDIRNSLTNDLYSLCNMDSKLKDPNYFQENALLFASRLSKIEVLKLLINDFNANLDSFNIYKNNAIVVAFKTKTNEGIDTALFLINNIDPKFLDIVSYGQYNILGEFLKTYNTYDHVNIEISKIEELLESILNKGFDINEEQGKNGSGFAICCKNQSWIIAAYLISKGADYSKKFEYLGHDSDMYTVLSAVQYLPPKAKIELLNIFKTVIEKSGEPYGKFSYPKHLYYCPLRNKPFEYDKSRFG